MVTTDNGLTILMVMRESAKKRTTNEKPLLVGAPPKEMINKTPSFFTHCNTKTDLSQTVIGRERIHGSAQANFSASSVVCAVGFRPLADWLPITTENRDRRGVQLWQEYRTFRPEAGVQIG
jgi:hypothetical protein